MNRLKAFAEKQVVAAAIQNDRSSRRGGQTSLSGDLTSSGWLLDKELPSCVERGVDSH